MSQHSCAWASNKGRELRLSCPERVTLWQLAERAASRGYCWPSIVQLMTDTGLAKATVIETLRSLVVKGLITIEKVGKQGRNYHLLDRSKSEPVAASKPVQKKTGKRFKSEPVTGSNPTPYRFKSDTQTGSKLNLNLKDNLKRTLNAREAGHAVAAAAAASDGRVVVSAVAPECDPLPPETGTTDGSGPFAGIEDVKAFASGVLRRPVHCDVPAEVVTEDDPPRTDGDRDRMAEAGEAVSQAATEALKPRKPPKPLSRDNQIAALEAGASPEQLERAARAFAMRQQPRSLAVAAE